MARIEAVEPERRGFDRARASTARHRSGRLSQAATRAGQRLLDIGIATTATAGGLLPRWLRFSDGGLVGRYVFPDGDLVTVEDAVGFARRAGFQGGSLDVARLLLARPNAGGPSGLPLRSWWH